MGVWILLFFLRRERVGFYTYDEISGVFVGFRERGTMSRGREVDECMTKKDLLSEFKEVKGHKDNAKQKTRVQTLES